MPEDAPGTEEEVTQETPEGSPAEAPAEQPTVDWDSDENPYKGRYSDLRSQYDRVHPVLDALQNPETQAEALQRYLGIVLQDEEGEETDFDPDEPMTRAEFGAYLAQIEQAQQAQQQAEMALDTDAHLIGEQIAEIEKDHGKLSEKELDALLPLALQHRDEQGRPGMLAAYELFSGLLDEKHKAYVASKKAPRVQTGAAGTDKIDVRDPEQLERAMLETIEAEQAADQL